MAVAAAAGARALRVSVCARVYVCVELDLQRERVSASQKSTTACVGKVSLSRIRAGKGRVNGRLFSPLPLSRACFRPHSVAC